MSRLDEAMKVVRANPKSSQAWSTLGELLASDGQSEKAAQSFQRALQLDPSNEVAQAGLASALSDQSAPEPTPTPAPAAPSFSETPVDTPPIGARVFESPVEERPVAEVAPVPGLQAESEPPKALGSTRPARASTAADSSGRRPLPPAPTKPSDARVRMGVLAILLALGLCACIFVVALVLAF